MDSIPVFCGKDCGGNACPLLASLDGGRVTRVANNPAGGKYLKGCRRGFDLPLTQYAPDRLLTPLVRVGPRGSGQFRPASWEEALRITAGRLAEIREKHGASSVLNLASAGTTGALHGTGPLLARFLNLFGGCTHLAGSYSACAATFILPYLLGDEWKAAGFDAATLQHSEMILLWGANVLDTRLGAEIPQRLVEAKKRGARIVVIDPRRSATAKQLATWWIPIRPGTDAALMLAVLHVFLTEGLADREFMDTHSTGFDRLESYVLGSEDGLARSPLWAEAICGVPAAEITRLARAYAAARPAALLPGYSIQRVFAGEETFRLAVALQLATGNFGRLGGSTGSLNNRLPAPRVGSLGVPAVPGQPVVPVLRWPDAVLHGRSRDYPTDIHAIYSLGGNFLNQGSDIRKNIAAFEKVDFAVCHEVFLTPTARYCDVVFPAATPLEKEDIGVPWAGNYLLYKPQAVLPAGQARSDYDALCDLADRLGFLDAFSEGRSARAWVQHFLDQSEVTDPDEFRRTGVYFGREQERVGLAGFASDPGRYPLSTPSGRVEIASQKYHQETGFPAIPTWQSPPEDSRYPLRLISPKSPNFTHSQGWNIPAVQAREARALVHPPAGCRRTRHPRGGPGHSFQFQRRGAPSRSPDGGDHAGGRLPARRHLGGPGSRRRRPGRVGQPVHQHHRDRPGDRLHHARGRRGGPGRLRELSPGSGRPNLGRDRCSDLNAHPGRIGMIPMRNVWSSLFLTAFLLGLAACTPASRPAGQEITQIPTTQITALPTQVITPAISPAGSETSSGSDLANTEWKLVSLGSPEAATPVVAGSTVTIKFTVDGQATGSAGCNSYGGQYRFQGVQITFSQIASTLMACADEKVMGQEQQYLQALETAGTFQIAGDQLTITYNNDQGVLTFRKGTAVPISPTPAPTTAAGNASATLIPTVPSSTSGETGYLDDRSTPTGLIQSYFNAINRKEYLRAYSYWRKPADWVGPFETFQQGYQNTVSVSLTLGQIGGDADAERQAYSVPVLLKSTTTDGKTQTFAACYVMRLFQPATQGAPPFKPLSLEKAHAQPVENNATAAALANACSTPDTPPGNPINPAPVTNRGDISKNNYLDDRSGPVEVLASLFNAVNRKEYVRAYSYWENAGTNPEVAPFDQFQKGYAETESVQLATGQVSGDAGAGQRYYSVPVVLTARTTSRRAANLRGLLQAPSRRPADPGSPAVPAAGDPVRCGETGCQQRGSRRPAQPGLRAISKLSVDGINQSLVQNSVV